MTLKTAFAPVIDADTQILILGSMPGEKSLVEQQYYANKQNAFWRIMFDVFNNGQSLGLYSDKLNLLHQHKIGLWDAYHACEREGSLDSNIRNGVLNDFESLFKNYPNIQLVLFNGGTSYASLKKSISVVNGCKYMVMPSTSPAYTLAYPLKLKVWLGALKL
jgi:hypoxanthine-DNA glycosylase